MKKIAFLLTICFAISEFLYASETNVVYLMMDPVAYFGDHTEAIATARQMQRESNSVESRPADLDPDGHWGKVVDGVQVSVRFFTNVFAPGQPINARVLVRNTSTNRVLLPSPQHLSIKFAVRSQHGDLPQKTEKIIRVSGPPALGLPAHRQISFSADLKGLFSLTNSGIYYVSARDTLLIDQVTSGNQVSSAEAAIQIVDRP